MKKLFCLILMVLSTMVSASAYTITEYNATGHGKVTPDRWSASEGDKVTIRYEIEDGYDFSCGMVLDVNDNPQWLTSDVHGEYYFIMPSSDVRVLSQFTPSGEPYEIIIGPGDYGDGDIGFIDVSSNQWYYNAVKWVKDNGVMSGIGNNRFDPQGRLSRAMIAQILYNQSDKEDMPGKDFTDVKEGSWYYNAVVWCSGNGLVAGYPNGRFGPNDDVTREQLAVMLWRKEGSPEIVIDLSRFIDSGSISDYAKAAMNWAVSEGIMVGSGGKLNPRGTATRAEAAQMFKNYIGG